MPFTLAHPAAVLPLRRFCPRFLDFPALVIGSLSPDVAYAARRWDLEKFSHGLAGSLLFCLPVGLLVWAAFDAVVRHLAPEPRPQQHSTLRTVLTVLFSVIAGIGTHIGWDSFTNNRGWVVMHVAALQIPILTIAGHELRVCHLLWYGFSFAGVAWLCREYWRWTEERTQADKSQGLSVGSSRRGGDSAPYLSETPAADASSAGVELREKQKSPLKKSLVCGVLVLPIGAVHHLLDGWIGAVTVAALSACLIAAVARIKEYEGPELE